MGNVENKQVLNKKVRAQETYNNDYQFANAPDVPKLTAIAGDNKVTLYWDDAAESTFDKFICKYWWQWHMILKDIEFIELQIQLFLMLK